MEFLEIIDWERVITFAVRKHFLFSTEWDGVRVDYYCGYLGVSGWKSTAQTVTATMERAPLIDKDEE